MELLSGSTALCPVRAAALAGIGKERIETPPCTGDGSATRYRFESDQVVSTSE